MGPGLFLNSLPELDLSFCSECLPSNLNQISIFVLWLLLLLFIFFKGIPSIRNFWKNEHTQKRQGRSKRRRNGGTRKGLRYHHREEEEERELISFLKSPLGQNHDTIHFRQLLCPDPSCEVCNNATAEINQLLDDPTRSVSPVAPTAPVTEPSFIQSSAFSVVPPEDLISPPLPEPSVTPPSILSCNSITLLGNSLSTSPSGQTLPPEPSPPLLESEFTGHHSSFQSKDSLTLTKYDCHQRFSDLHSTNISFVEDPADKLLDPKHLLFLSPDEHNSVKQYSYPKIWEDHLKQKVIQLFWGLPSLHSESLTTVLHVSGDCSSIFFNCVSRALTGQESPGLPYFSPPSLPGVQPQPLPQTLPLSQYSPLTQIQPQTHLQSQLPILPSTLIPQTRVCGVYCHTPLNESECLNSSETELEWNVLQKKQAGLWGLPSVVQNSHDACYPSVPTLPLRRPSKAPVSISIDYFEFPLSSKIRAKLEHHLKKRIIQHRWGMPRRINESLLLMKPRFDCSDRHQSKSCYGLSWISSYKSESSTLVNKPTPSADFYKKHSDMSQSDHLMSDSDGSSDKNVESDSDMMNLSEEEKSTEPGKSQEQLENLLKVHLSKKFDEIKEGQLPGTVQNSQHSMQKIFSVESHFKIKQGSMSSVVTYLNTSTELSFLDEDTKETLEKHITNLYAMLLCSPPPRNLAALEAFTLKDTSSPSLIDPHSSSSTRLISEANAKPEAFTPLRGSSEPPLDSDKVGVKNSATNLNLPLPATSLVGEEEQGILRQQPPDMPPRRAEEIKKILQAKSSLQPVTNTSSGKTSQTHSRTGNIQPSKLPATQAGTRSEPKNKNVNFKDKTEIRQGTNREKSEPASVPNMSREIVRAQGLNNLQPKTSDVLSNSKPVISQKIDVKGSNGEAVVTTESLPAKKSLIQDSNLSELKKQLIAEMNLKLKNSQHSQAQGQSTDLSHDADNSTHKASLTHAQGVSSADKGVSQVLHVQSEDRVNMDKRQEPWLPKQVIRSCQDTNFSPAVKKVSATGSKSELGAGDAQLRISQHRENRTPSQDTPLEEIPGSKSPQTQSQKEQAPPDSLFLNKMKSFFQRLNPGIKGKTQENPQEMGNPMSFTQSRGPVQSRAAFTGTTQVRRVTSDTGKLPEERVGRRHAIATTCLQDHLPAAAQFGKAPQKRAVQAPAGPVHGPPINSRAPSYSTKSNCQATIFAGQRSTSSGHTGNENRYPPKVVSLKGQQSVPCRRTVPHPTYRP